MDLTRGEIKIEAGGGLLDKMRTATDDPKSTASHRTVPVEDISVRHTLATIMHRAGLAPSDAAALLGHTVAVHLARYVTPTEKRARAAASGLGAAISGLG